MSEVTMTKYAAALKRLDPEDPWLANHAREMAKVLVPVKIGEVRDASYFKNAGRAAAQAFVIHLETGKPEEQQSLRALFDCVFGSEAELRHLWEVMKKNPACEGLVKREAKRREFMEMQFPEEFSAVISTLQLELLSREPLPEEQKEEVDAD